MNPIMCIYNRLKPRLLVQVGDLSSTQSRVGLGLLHWTNMSNISQTPPPPKTQGRSSMKDCDWISLKGSLEDALKKPQWYIGQF